MHLALWVLIFLFHIYEIRTDIQIPLPTCTTSCNQPASPLIPKIHIPNPLSPERTNTLNVTVLHNPLVDDPCSGPCSASPHPNLRRQTPPYPSLCRPHPPSPATPVRGVIAAAFACYLPALFALFSFGIGPPSPSPHYCQASTGEVHGDIVILPKHSFI